MWMLIPAVVLLPLILNLRQWRLDLARVQRLVAARMEIPPLDLHGNPAPRVSFLVAAWNEESTLLSCLEAIQRLGYPNLEIVLCAGGTDRTWQIASKFSDPRLILLPQDPGDGKQKSLQRCLERAGRGEILYLLDADCLITGAAFARMLAPILGGGEQAVTGSPCTPFPEQFGIPFVMSQCASRVYTSLFQPENCSGLVGANCAITRRVLEQAGGFNAAVRAGGDYDLGKRLRRQGTRVHYEVEASIPIEFHSEVRAYLRQQARWIRNVVIHGWRFGEYREVASCLCTSLVGLAMLALPCFSLVLALLPAIPPAIVQISVAAWALAFLHALFSRLRYLNMASRWLGVRFPRRVTALLPLFLMIDFVAWTIPLIQYPSKAGRERW
jgi:cellulose synthase/poly-beta-1,6-N-acetylglucosamine synthase-like glycosyltransferase